MPGTTGALEMDLNTVARYRSALIRSDLALAPGERILGGGTWLFSEPQIGTSGLVDLTTMELAGHRIHRRRTADRRDLHHRRTLEAAAA